jgi:L-arabinose isomerase
MPQQLCDFAEMADIECLLIDESTNIRKFKKELRWNDAYFTMSRGR